MASLKQWNLLKTLKNVENRMCVDCNLPLTKNDSFASSFGTLLCSACSRIHQALFSQNGTWVKSVLNDEWSDADIETVIGCNRDFGGNIGYNEIYEKYIPHGWTKPNATDSLTKDREFWIRCKYTAKAFMVPHRIGYDMNLNAHAADSYIVPKNDVNADGVLPSRIADFFIVIGAHAEEAKKMKDADSVNDFAGLRSFDLKPQVQCTYPNPNAYPDMQIPDMLGEFVYAQGIKMSAVEKQPKFYTFVLTDVTGAKLYGCALHIYELMEPSELTDELGISMDMLNTLVEHGEMQCNETRPNSRNTGTVYPVLYAPRALVVLSHYSFFHLFKQFLSAIYRLSLSSLPLPIERYIINFISEMPLPPQGVTEVNFVMPTQTLQVTRPRRNQLPMVDISFRPLFTALSVDNIISVFTALCCEYPVCIVSNNTSLLTPICEALLSFLFPFTWQGAYIPILPDTMTEILDAPVPYLIGMQRDYFDKYEMHMVKNRPPGSIFVDIDKDVVHVGTVDDLFGDECSEEEPMLLNIEKPNAKLLTKLRDGLMKYGGCIYHKPSEKYHNILQSCGVAFPYNEHLIPLKVDGHYNGPNVITSKGNKGSTANAVTSNVNSSGSQEFCTKAVSGNDSMAHNNVSKNSDAQYSKFMSDPWYNNPTGGENEIDNFCAQEIRFAFLRFFVALLLDYHDYFSYEGIDGGGTSGTFVLPESVNNSSPSRDSDVSSVVASDDGMISVRRSDSLSSLDSTASVNKRKSALGALFRGKDTVGGTEDPAAMAAVHGIPPVFATEKFVQNHPNDLFLKNITQTQIFAKFLQEKTAALMIENDIKYNEGRGADSSQIASFEVKYFDESILSKRNRSRMKLVKNETPFLSDMQESVSETYTTPTANNYGIAMESSYTYSKFPTKLDPKYCSPVRVPKVLVKNVEVVRKNSQALTTANILSNAGTHGRRRSQTQTDIGIEDSQFQYMGLSGLEAYLDEVKLHHEQTIRCVVILQSLFRMKVQYRQFHSRFKELKRLLALGNYRRRILQFVRMALCKCRYKRWRRSAIRLQANFRGRKQCKIYNYVVKKRVISLQALLRRKRTMRIYGHLCAALVKEIRHRLPLLWQLSGTALLHRSRFWRFFDVLSDTPRSKPKHRIGYVALALYYREFHVLFNALGYNCNSAGSVCSSSAAIAASCLSEHRTILTLSRCLGYLVANNAQLTQLASPSNNNYKSINMAGERLELYTIMKQHFDEDIKDDVFHNFDLKVTRKRKQTLVNMLWTTVDADVNPLPLDRAAAIVLQIHHTLFTKLGSSSRSGMRSSIQAPTVVCDRLMRMAKQHQISSSKPNSLQFVVTPGDSDWLQCVYAAPVYVAVGEFSIAIAKRYRDLHEKNRMIVEAGSYSEHHALSRTSTYTDAYLDNRRYSRSYGLKSSMQRMGTRHVSNTSVEAAFSPQSSTPWTSSGIGNTGVGTPRGSHGRMGTPRRPSRYFIDVNSDVFV